MNGMQQIYKVTPLGFDNCRIASKLEVSIPLAQSYTSFNQKLYGL